MEVYYSGESNLLIFPNPAISTGEINILVKRNDAYVLKILDMLGKELRVVTEQDYPQVVSVSGLTPGYYIVCITFENGVSEAQVFIVTE
ncbi:MAG: T9SS type A sorting domain-containing protein [Saprospiraceae bacterium]